MAKARTPREDYLAYLGNPTLCLDPAAAAAALEADMCSALAEAGDSPRGRLLAEGFAVLMKLDDILLRAMAERQAVAGNLIGLLDESPIECRPPFDRRDRRDKPRRWGGRRRCR